MKRFSAFLLVLAAVSASAQTADLRRDLERMDRRLRALEAAPSLRVLSRPGMVPQQWTEVPGWRTLELVPAGGTTFETTSGQKTVRVVVRTTGGAGQLSVTNGIGGDGGASPLRVKLGAGLAFDGSGNVSLSMPDYAYFPRGVTLGTDAWTNAAGTLRRAPDGFRPQVSDGANWYPVGDLSDAPSDTNAYARKGGAWVPVPTNPPSGSGSGFPLTNDVSAGGFALEGAGLLSANYLRLQDGAYVTNDVSLRDLAVRRNAAVFGDVVVHGNFTLIGSATNLVYTVVDIRTNVYGGTNYVDTTVYSTQVVYQTIVYTNMVTTNEVYTYVSVGGTWDAADAAWVAVPGLYADGESGTNSATGTWDFSGGTTIGLDEFDPAFTAALPGLLDGSRSVVDYPVTSANATVALDATNKAYRVHCSGAGTITNWSIAGVSTAALDVVAVQLEPGAATDFSWGTALATNVALPAANSTNVYFFWRGAAGTGWTVD